MTLILRLATSRKAIKEYADQNQVFRAVWATHTDSKVNAPRTLPLPIRSKQDISADLISQKGSDGIHVKLALNWAYMKELMKFYRHGMTSVWQNKKLERELRKRRFVIPAKLDLKGKEMAVLIPLFAVLVKEMAQALYMDRVEHSTFRENTSKLVKRANEKDITYTTGIFLLTRGDMQLLRRTPGDFNKIPMFAVLVAIFMETTPILCYTFPDITPLTCVLPSILPRIWNKSHLQQLRETTSDISDLDSLAMKTAYNLDIKQVQLLCSALRLKLKYLPSAFYPQSTLRDRLHSYTRYLVVDNYYLSGLNGGGNLWNLDNAELVLACLERNLVDDIDAVVKVQTSGTAAEREEVLNSLRLKLMKFVLEFDAANAGYLVAGGLLDPPSRDLLDVRNKAST